MLIKWWPFETKKKYGGIAVFITLFCISSLQPYNLIRIHVEMADYFRISVVKVGPSSKRVGSDDLR